MTDQIKLNRRANFTMVQNEILRDPSLSFRAKGILAFLLSHSEDFKIRMVDLHKWAGEGRDACLSAVKELVDAGFVVHEKKRGENGQMYTITHIYDEPVTGKPDTGSPDPEKPGSGGSVPFKKTNTEDQYKNKKGEEKSAHTEDPMFEDAPADLQNSDLLKPWNEICMEYEWIKGFKRQGAKIGFGNWDQWKSIVDKYGVGPNLIRIIEAIQSTKPTERWPDVVETKLLAQNRGGKSEGALEITLEDM